MMNTSRRNFLIQTGTTGLAAFSGVTRGLFPACGGETPEGLESSLARAAASAQIAGYSLSKVQRWLHERCLPAIDPGTGLYRGRLQAFGQNDPAGEWNYRDTAADCYPFVVWASFYTDRDAFEGPMRDILHTEQRLCNHIDRLPVDYDMDKKQKIERSFDQIVFGASEYAKDGLTAVVELTGKDEWYDRLKGIVEDLFKHAKVETPYGNIPSENIEVNGELMQLLPRLYTMTGEEEFLDWAHRLGDYYLKPGKFVPERLSDHGCEIIGGLGLLLAVDSIHNREKFEEYLPHMRYMFDEILLRGTNSDGIIIGTLEAEPRPP